MKQFKCIDNLMGWITFAIAACVYGCTIEPTASFWDCPEFITTAYKLEVGHPPGAPFFMLTGNFFTQFVSDPTKVAYMVNMMSALLSAFCILFLFWSISHLARKLIATNGQQVETWGQLIAVEASALTGALIYTFSDTFWYSAVEGEVYAYSSLFTAVVFWLMLKWEEHAHEPQSDRWLILIAYLVGLSVGVHLLNLLCLPALVLIYYYRRFPNANTKGSIKAVIVGFILIAAVLYGIVPGIVKVGGWFELFFVNTLHMPFNTGLIVYMVVLVSTVLWSIWESVQQKSRLRMNISYLCSVALLGIPFYGYGITCLISGIVLLGILSVALFRQKDLQYWISARLMNTTLLCMLMIMIGYSSYAVIVIRSSANTPMDQNSPEDIFTLGRYLSREQYGDTPLFYGKQYSSQVLYKTEGNYCVPASKKGAPVYQRKEKETAEERDQYIVQRYDLEYVYAQNALFPRMHSDRHADEYEDWLGGVKGKRVSYNRCGETVQVKVPTALENIRFFLSYQVNFMYWRYFMWNFAGRQNDIQGNGSLEKGNWISGIPFLDNLRLGDQSKLPALYKDNKGHNVFYCLPLILGIIGLIWQLNNNKHNREGEKQFWIVSFLFFMTGLAIVIYLNQTPSQPRERDYAYAASFYAFAIWCGLGVAAIVDYLNQWTRNEKLAVLVGCLFVGVPVQMASQTWDDHDRSGRYTCRDFGQNYLETLDAERAPIIFTNGDNDTFPLWYCQETEGIRTDARVCNLSYLQTDWYIDQMRRPAYNSPSVPIHWSRLQYVEGTREAVPVEASALKQVMEYYKDQPKEVRDKVMGENPYELKNILEKWVLNPNPELQIIPTDSLVISVDKEAVKRSGMLIAADSIPDVMTISLKGKRAVYKSELMMYEMLVQCNWERPIYIATTVGPSNWAGLGDYFVQEGLAYRITPFNTKKSGKNIDTERMYDNMMNKYKFGGVDQPGLYLDETILRMCYSHRDAFIKLAKSLLKEGKIEKASKVVDYIDQAISPQNAPHSYNSGSLELANLSMLLDKKEYADQLACLIAKHACEYMDWYVNMKPSYLASDKNSFLYLMYQLTASIEILQEVKSEQLNNYMEQYYRFSKYAEALQKI